ISIPRPSQRPAWSADPPPPPPKTSHASPLATSAPVLSLSAPTHAQSDCGAWNTASFFEAATRTGVECCIASGADTEARDEYGGTPLRLAAGSGTAGTVNALLAAGADAERGADGGTPLDHAEENEAAEGADAYWRLNDARF
ncbi:MAG: hypothetical protein OXC91_04460, partial [Rhodobacteraceae bacterium]|nr:hypothetical protein [Paracoccaceae bacterium]